MARILTKNVTKEEAFKMCSLREQGYTHPRISDITGRSKNCIIRTVQRYMPEYLDMQKLSKTRFTSSFGRLSCNVTIPLEFTDEICDELYSDFISGKEPWDIIYAVIERRINKTKPIENKKQGVDYEYIKSKWVTSVD